MKLLIVVDYQNDFVDGSLGFAGAEALEDGIMAAILECQSSGGDVIFTLDTHKADYLETLEGKSLPVEHCIEGTKGWQPFGKLEGLKDNFGTWFTKRTFGSDELFDHLRGTRYESITLVGLVTNICVIANAVLAKTAQPETPVTVDARLCKSFDPALHDAALDVLEGLHVRVIRD